MFWCYVCVCYLGSERLAVLERWLLYRGRLQCFGSARIVLFGVREVGCIREVGCFREVAV